MEIADINKKDEEPKLNVDIDDTTIKENKIEVIESTKERSPIDDDLIAHSTNVEYDEDDEDSGEDIAVITKTSVNVDLSPAAKNMFNIKTISNTQIHSNYKISKTAIDLDHPGNINGVPTIDYDLSKLNDECKPWKKPGADVSDFFNYGFNEDTWLLYCEKQKALRLNQENSAIKTLSGLSNFGYNLSGSHMHLGFNRLNQKNSKGGLIDVIGCQQNGDFKNKHNDMGMSNKISTIPVQTGHMNSNQNQSGNYMSGMSLTNQAISNNLLNPIMSALAMGMIPNGNNVNAVLGNQQNMPIDAKMSQYSMDGGGSRNYVSHNSNNWGTNNQNYDRQNSVDSMHSHEEYNEKKSYPKIERGSRREEPRRYRSKERREKSVEKRRRTRSRSKERGHDNKYSRVGKRTRTPEESRRNRKHSRERDPSTESSKRRRAHRATKKHKQSRSRSQESRKDRRHRRKSPTDKHKKEGNHVDVDKSDSIADNIKREKEATMNG